MSDVGRQATPPGSLNAAPPNVTNEDLFQRNRGAIYSSAIGLARLALQSGEADKALQYLDEAVEQVHEAWWQALLDDGYEEPLIEKFLGPRKRPT